MHSHAHIIRYKSHTSTTHLYKGIFFITAVIVAKRLHETETEFSLVVH